MNKKSNEITAIPALLHLLDIKGCIVTIDAMGCQTAIAQTLLEQDADYVLALKGNQGNLSDEVTLLFEQSNLPLKEQTTKDIDSGHSRIETRRCRQIKINKKYLPASERWPKLNSIIEIEATRDDGTKTSSEKRYYISSLALDTEKAALVVRQHWAVENKLHWVLDVTFGGDESRIQAEQWGGGNEHTAALNA